MSLATLPGDIIIQLVKTLDSSGDALSLGLTCDTLHRLVLDDSLWESSFRSRWEVNEIMLRRKQSRKRTWYQLYLERDLAAKYVKDTSAGNDHWDEGDWDTTSPVMTAEEWRLWIRKAKFAALVFKDIVTEHVESVDKGKSEPHNIRQLREKRTTEYMFVVVVILMSKYERESQKITKKKSTEATLQAVIPMIYTLVTSMCLSQDNCPEVRKFAQALQVNTASIHQNASGRRTVNLLFFRISYWKWDNRRSSTTLLSGVADLHPYLKMFHFLFLAREFFWQNPSECYPFARFITPQYLHDPSLDVSTGLKEQYINSVLRLDTPTEWKGVFMHDDLTLWALDPEDRKDGFFCKSETFVFSRGENVSLKGTEDLYAVQTPFVGTGIRCKSRLGEVRIYVEMRQGLRPVEVRGYLTPWGIVGTWQDLPEGGIQPPEMGRAWLYPEYWEVLQ